MNTSPRPSDPGLMLRVERLEAENERLRSIIEMLRTERMALDEMRRREARRCSSV